MQRFKQLLSRYQQNRDLIAIGAYTQGADAETDAALERFPHLRAFIQQGLNQRVLMAESMANLQSVIKPQGPKTTGPLAAQHQPR
jgi:flagellum-specific ATP synthase